MTQPELLSKSLGCPGTTGVECGGKGSATPLWLRVAYLTYQRIAAAWESGVALRLPPQSKATFSTALSRSWDTGDFGLGLAIVKTCVEACQGTVSARNRVPHGLEVEIVLQAAP